MIPGLDSGASSYRKQSLLSAVVLRLLQAYRTILSMISWAPDRFVSAQNPEPMPAPTDLAGTIKSFLSSRIVGGLSWILGSTLLGRAIGMASSIVVARLLTTTTYGEFGMIQSTVGMVGTFAGLGMGMTVTRSVATSHELDPERTSRVIRLCLIIATLSGSAGASLLYLLAPWISTRSLAAPQLASLLRLSAPLLILGTLSGTQSGVLMGLRAFKSVATVNVAVAVLSLPLLIVPVYHWGLSGGVYGLLLVAVATAIVNHLAMRHALAAQSISLSTTGCMKEINVLWQFSLPAVLTMSMAGPVMWLGSVFVVSQPGGYAEFGVFAAANKWKEAILAIPYIAAQPLLAVLSGSPGRTASGRQRALRAAFFVTSATALFPAIAIIVLSRAVMASFGAEFAGGQWTLIWVSIAAVLAAPSIAAIQFMASRNEMWTNFRIHMLWAAAFLVLVYCLRGAGGRGMGLAVAISYALQLIAYILQIRKRKD